MKLMLTLRDLKEPVVEYHGRGIPPPLLTMLDKFNESCRMRSGQKSDQTCISVQLQ